MSANTNTKVPNPSNPSSLKPRYEIRKLKPKHLPWVAAMVIHANLFHSPVWPLLYPEKLTDRLHRATEAALYLCEHQINSGLSFAVFDTEYKFKREESKATGGKLYWDANEPSIQEEKGIEAESKRLLDQMDFPIVSGALSYDSFNHLDMKKMVPLIAELPHYAVVFDVLYKNDRRDPETWQAKGPNEVLFRNATFTRHDYEGEGTAAALARWLMREADARGFRGIQIECLHDGVTHIWSNPPEPYKGGIVSEFNMATWRDEEGKLAFSPSQQRATKCYVDLKPKT